MEGLEQITEFPATASCKLWKQEREFIKQGTAAMSKFAVYLSILLLLASGAVFAQTATPITTQFASGVTAPLNGLVLSGTAINPATGQPIRHLWFADATNGFCRLDPDVDTAGTHSLNLGTCLKSVVGGNAFTPGGSAFDANTNNVYVADLGRLGIVRLHFVPTGDNGQGLIDPVQQEVLGGVARGVGGCNIFSGNPNSVALGPDGNLYVGMTRIGNIMRIRSPRTEPLPCSNVQPQIISTPDLRRDSGLAWVGHTLFGNDTHGPWGQQNADQCSTPQNNFTACRVGFNAFGGQVVSPNNVVSDQIYPALGNNLYFSSAVGVTEVANVATSLTITQNFGGTAFNLCAAWQWMRRTPQTKSYI
jgi:hypothetical protein